MSGTKNLVRFIDNGGNRSHVERRKNPNVYFLQDRRSINERRKQIDRRKILNQRREEGPERRAVFLK